MAKHYFIVVGEVKDGEPTFEIDLETTDNKFDGKVVYDEEKEDLYVDGVFGEWVSAMDYIPEDSMLTNALAKALDL
jgi:hypothetical protein